MVQLRSYMGHAIHNSLSEVICAYNNNILAYIYVGTNISSTDHRILPDENMITNAHREKCHTITKFNVS